MDFANENNDTAASVHGDGEDEDENDSYHKSPNVKGSFNIIMNNQIRLFTYEHVRYVLNADSEQYVRLRNLDESSTVNGIMHSRNNGVSSARREIL